MESDTGLVLQTFGKRVNQALRARHSAGGRSWRTSRWLAVMKSSPPTTLVANTLDAIDQQVDIGYGCRDKENDKQRCANRKGNFVDHTGLFRPRGRCHPRGIRADLQ